jgi:hypothetical protein
LAFAGKVVEQERRGALPRDNQLCTSRGSAFEERLWSIDNKAAAVFICGVARVTGGTKIAFDLLTVAYR